MKTAGRNASVLFPFVLGIILVGTWFVLSSPVPDERTLRSDDGIVVLDVPAGMGAGMDIFFRDDVTGPFTTVVGPVYEIVSPTGALPVGTVLSFAVRPEWFGERSDALAVAYAYDAPRGAWEAMPSVYDPSERQVTVTLSAPSAHELWAVGIRRDFSLAQGDYVLMEDAVAHPPVGAVGYEGFFAVASAPSDFVLVPMPSVTTDGCFDPAGINTLTTREWTREGVTVRAGVRWTISGDCGFVSMPKF